MANMTENHVESCHCWHCGGYGKISYIFYGDIEKWMECPDCKDGNLYRAKLTQTTVIRAFLTQTKHALEDIEMNCTYLDKVYGKIDNLIADVEEYERIVGTREKDTQ